VAQHQRRPLRVALLLEEHDALRSMRASRRQRHDDHQAV
jgi:hypothetical protein